MAENEELAGNEELHSPEKDEHADRECTPPRLNRKQRVQRKPTHKSTCPLNPSRRLVFSSQEEESVETSKKTSKKRKRKVKRRHSSTTKKQRFQHRDIEVSGTWVQCSNRDCMKWRYLTHVTDPSHIPDLWTCDMNSDTSYNSCILPEQDYSTLEFVHSKFTEGSLVWAKMQGFPWWPAMIEEDPDTELCLYPDPLTGYVTDYHVVFLDKHVTRCWLKVSNIQKYGSGDCPGPMTLKGHNYSQKILAARETADKAMALPLEERLRAFGFSASFKGPWGEDEDSSSDESSMAKTAQGRKADKKKTRKLKARRPIDLDDDDVGVESLLSHSDMEDILDQAEVLLEDVQSIVMEAEEGELSLQEMDIDENIKTSKKRKEEHREDADKTSEKMIKKNVEDCMVAEKKRKCEVKKIDKKEVRDLKKKEKSEQREREKQEKKDQKLKQKQELVEKKKNEKQAEKERKENERNEKKRKAAQEKMELKEKEKKDKKELKEKRKAEKKELMKPAKAESKDAAAPSDEVEEDPEKRAEKEKQRMEKEEKKKLKKAKRKEEKRLQKEKESGSEKKKLAKGDAGQDKVKPCFQKPKKMAFCAPKQKPSTECPAPPPPSPAKEKESSVSKEIGALLNEIISETEEAGSTMSSEAVEGPIITSPIVNAVQPAKDGTAKNVPVKAVQKPFKPKFSIKTKDGHTLRETTVPGHTTSSSAPKSPTPGSDDHLGGDHDEMSIDISKILEANKETEGEGLKGAGNRDNAKADNLTSDPGAYPLSQMLDKQLEPLGEESTGCQEDPKEEARLTPEDAGEKPKSVGDASTMKEDKVPQKMDPLDIVPQKMEPSDIRDYSPDLEDWSEPDGPQMVPGQKMLLPAIADGHDSDDSDPFEMEE